MVDELVIGSVLGGKYRIERFLGEGGMGAVVAVRHCTLGEPFAVKVLPADADRVLRERFLREARASAQIRHPHVVDVFDIGEHEGATFMVMELLEGEDLERIIARRGPLPIAEAVRYAGQACDGLAAAHAVGVVHRDVKPSNLLVQQGWVKLLDFGISTEALSTGSGRSSLTQTGSVLGTPRYMSPEQLVSSRDVDGRADVWSLGATLYELVTGVPPFGSEDMVELCAAIVRHDPRAPRELRPEIPPALEALILRCLQKDPDDRFADVTALREALRPFARTADAAPAHRISVDTADPLAKTLADDVSSPLVPTIQPALVALPLRPAGRSVLPWVILALLLLSALAVVGAIAAFR
jgi:eukaryotic-like serine/threonine-protein kinase